MSINTRQDLEAAFIANGGEAVRLIQWNKLELFCRIEGGMIEAAIVKDHGPDHGKLAGASRQFKFLQQARAWFYQHAGYMER